MKKHPILAYWIAVVVLVTTTFSVETGDFKCAVIGLLEGIILLGFYFSK